MQGYGFYHTVFTRISEIARGRVTLDQIMRVKKLAVQQVSFQLFM
jgi:hypothetical protein